MKKKTRQAPLNFPSAKMLKAVLWKHFTVRLNSPGRIILTICEFAIPIIAFLAIIRAKSKVGDLEKVYINRSTTLQGIPKEELFTKLNIGATRILYAPETQVTNALIREVQLKLNLYHEAINGFKSKEALLEFYNKGEPSGVTVAILFHASGDSLQKVPKRLQYEIMIYEEGVLWDTNRLFYNEFIYTPGQGSEVYIDKAFAAVQVALDISFTEKVSNTTFNTPLTFQEFPYPPYTNTDGVTMAFRYILPFITIICFIFICPITLKRIVMEKTSGLKELLKISGAKSMTLWFGWYLNGMVINALSVTCIAFLLTNNLFGGSYPTIEFCNVFILALFLLLYCSATVTFFFAFSTLFKKASLAMVLGVLLWITSYSIFVGAAENLEVMTFSVKSLFTLIPTIALYYGYSAISLFELRETKLMLQNLFESPTSSVDDLSLGFVMTMLVIESVLYFLLALYLDKIWPGPYGISKPWHFIFKWALKRNAVTDAPDISLLHYNEEPSLKPVVTLQNVRKIYENNVAVDDLTMAIYKGTVTSLLGENGAGKTTTMSMLTGFTKATSGKILIGDCDINENIDLARRKVSLCTQGNLLYDELTVMQHLKLFGMLKGMSAKAAMMQAKELLETTLNLSEKADRFVSELSGGMKRKLSLGIALMGNPEVLILDEPTSGVDIEGRQEIWNLITSFKGERTILISTHFLEEAEYLSDYIAIMNTGRLLCYGTPLELKKKYGVGYNCLISYVDDGLADQIETILKPFKKDGTIERKSKRKIIQCCFNEAAKTSIPDLLRVLNKSRASLDISYKFNTTTLEDIYLKVQDRDAEPAAFDQNEDISNAGFLTRRCQNLHHQLRKRYLFLSKKWFHYLFLTLLFFFIVLLTFSLGKSSYQDVSKDGTKLPIDLKIYGNTDVYYNIDGKDGKNKLESYYRDIVTSSNSAATKVDHLMKAIIKKGDENIAHYMKRMIVATEFNFDRQNRLSHVLLLHSNKALHGAPIGINIVMNTLLKYIVGNDYSIAITNTPLHSNSREEQALTQSEFSNLFLWLTVLPIGPLFLISAVLLLPTTEHIKSIRVLERLFGITSLEYWIHNFVWDWMFYFFSVSVLFILMFLPLNSLDSHAKLTLYGIFLSYGFICIPFAYLFTYNKSVEGAYARFLILHIICAPIIAAILFALENVHNYEEWLSSRKYVVFVLDPHVFLCYVLAKFSVKLISNHNWDIMPEEAKKYLCSNDHDRHPCCVPDSLECANQRAYIDDTGLHWMLFVFLLYIFYLSIKNTLEKCVSELFVGVISSCFCGPDNKIHERFALTKLGSSSISQNQNNLLKVLGVSKKYITLSGVRPKLVRAVKNLTFDLQKGKCLGLLGVNGAGKSTSFRILAEEIKQSGGTVEVTREATSAPINCFNQMMPDNQLTKGYCPQHNALLDDFTGRELLDFYGRLRRLPNLNETATKLLDKFDMTSIADKPCGTYSGGNKRKLATCISIIGLPECILLDEPTSGVDPVSRRELWDVIQTIKRQACSAIVLTSHSMDECETLCDVLCILKEGLVVENGPINTLKTKYCTGHVLNVKLKTAKAEDGVDQIDGSNNFIGDLQQRFKSENIKVLGTHNAVMQVRIFNSDWLTIFETIEKMKGEDVYNIDDYWVKEASLQEVLMQVAKDNNVDGGPENV